MRKERVGFAMCGSFCTHEKVLAELEKLVQLYETVIPIASEISAFTDTRFGTSDDLMERLEDLTGHEVLCDIPSVEPIGPKGLLDVLVIAPATGNTIAKLAAGITDTAVTMAAKAHLRNGRPILLAPSTNDGLAGSAPSLGALLNRRYIYFVPFGQDDPERKPTSLVSDFSQVADAAQAALEGRPVPPLPPLARRCETAVRQFRLSAAQKGEHIACLEARKHYAWYLKGVPYAGYYKEQISKISTLEDIDRITAGIQRDLRD